MNANICFVSLKIIALQPYHDEKSSSYQSSFARLIPLKDIYAAIKNNI